MCGVLSWSILFVAGGSEDVMLGCTSGSPLPFLTLEPPISDTDYNFSLDITEGVYDLFDFNFWPIEV